MPYFSEEDRLWLENHIAETGAFQEKSPPVLGASGIPLFYFINTEKLLPDGGKWADYGEDSAAMIYHAAGFVRDPNFAKVIELIEKKTKDLVDFSGCEVSGFQRRDWIFSGVLAKETKKSHLSIYKDGRMKSLRFQSDSKCEVDFAPQIAGKKTVHVSDLLTVGSSALNGWIPKIKSGNARAELFLSVVDRNQGGRERVSAEGIKTDALFVLNEEFISRHAGDKQRCVGYFRNPQATVAEYLEKEGAIVFAPFFDPSPKNRLRERALLFWKSRKDYLSEVQAEALRAEVKNLYRTTPEEILADSLHPEN